MAEAIIRPTQSRPRETQHIPSLSEPRHCSVSYGHWIRTGFCSQSPNHSYATRTCHSSFANFVLKLATYLLTPPDHQPMTEDQRFNLMMPFSSLLQCGPTYMTTTTHAGLSHKCFWVPVWLKAILQDPPPSPKAHSLERTGKAHN